MTSAQIFGLALAGLILVSAVILAVAAALGLKEGREKRRYRALVDEDRAREIALNKERIDLEVQVFMSGLDEELEKLQREGR